MNSIRIAHISDPHFAAITYNPKQFFSKRWLGNCNLILFRQQTYRTNHLIHLPELFSSLGVDLVAITGDLTTTSLEEEYKKAKIFVDSFKERNMITTLLPGNHDIYTKESEKAKRFYNYFPSPAAEGKIEVKKVKEGFWWIGLDCAYASNLFLSNGKFTNEMENSLRKSLEKISANDSIIIGNHFPLFSTGNMRHDLQGAKRLQALLKEYNNIKLYLHGHDHISYLIDRRNEGMPLVCNAGSVSHLPGGSFYLLELSKEKCCWQHFSLKSEIDKNQWVLQEEKTFSS